MIAFVFFLSTYKAAPEQFKTWKLSVYLNVSWKSKFVANGLLFCANRIKTKLEADKIKWTDGKKLGLPKKRHNHGKKKKFCFDLGDSQILRYQNLTYLFFEFVNKLLRVRYSFKDKENGFVLSFCEHKWKVCLMNVTSHSQN